MKLVLINSQSDEEIKFDAEKPVTVGRGPLFCCYDKRVSRNHGRIQLTSDGNVLVAALHSNPCFFMKDGLPPIHQIVKNEEKMLGDGDYFGLLPDSFWYKIIVKDKEDIQTDDPSLNGKLKCDEPSLEPHDRSNKPKIEKSESTNDKNCVEVSSQSDVNVKLNEGSCVEEQENATAATNVETSELDAKLKALEKTKKLPLWMYEIDDFPNTSKSEGFNKAVPAVSIDEPELGQEVNQGGPIHESTSCPGDQEKGPADNAHEPHNDSKNDEIVSTSNAGSNIVISGECDMTVSQTNKEETQENDCDASKTCGSKRPICQYEGKCYRRNEQHKKEYCHPGDSDFIPYKDRPVCQYGSACYRRNAMHRIEYRHPGNNTGSNRASTNKATRSPKRKKRKKEAPAESSEDDYEDLEDPFVDDATSDEFIPSDATEDEEYGSD